MLQPSILTLGILTDDGEVYILVTGRNAGNGLAYYYGGVDVEGLTHGYVPGVVAVDWGVKDP